jgi:hypothetical protein
MTNVGIMLHSFIRFRTSTNHCYQRKRAKEATLNQSSSSSSYYLSLPVNRFPPVDHDLGLCQSPSHVSGELIW